MGLANDIGTALSAFSGAIVAQTGSSDVPNGSIPTSGANQVNEGLLGLAYDIGTAPVSYAKGKTDVAPVQALASLPNE